MPSTPFASLPRVSGYVSVVAPTVRSAFLHTARRSADAVEHEAVRAAWAEPSALEAYSVGGLAAHLCRSILTLDGYLQQDPPPASSASQLTAAEYFVTALGDHDPVDSDRHAAIRQRSSDMAASGRSDVLQATHDALDRLTARLPEMPPGHVLSVFEGLAMDLDQYVRTRIVELCIHGDDLAASVGGLEIDLGDDAWRITREVLVELAALRVGNRDLALGLSRRERSDRPLAL